MIELLIGRIGRPEFLVLTSRGRNTPLALEERLEDIPILVVEIGEDDRELDRLAGVEASWRTVAARRCATRSATNPAASGATRSRMRPPVGCCGVSADRYDGGVMQQSLPTDETDVTELLAARKAAEDVARSFAQDRGSGPLTPDVTVKLDTGAEDQPVFLFSLLLNLSDDLDPNEYPSEEIKALQSDLRARIAASPVDRWRSVVQAHAKHRGSRGKLASMGFTRISVRADQMGGVPCIRGLRIPVATVLGMLADQMSVEEILAAYPDLEAEDVREAMRYAAEAVRERELPLTASA